MNTTQEIVPDLLREALHNYNWGQRRITIRTGPGGADMFEEAFEKKNGLKRIYLSKPSRILKRYCKFWKSYKGRWYKLVKTNSTGNETV